MIECYALEKGIVNINKTQWEKILQKGIELQKKLLESKKPLEFYELDKELHMAVVNSSVNSKIIKSYLQLYPLVIMSQQLDPYYDRSMREHILLIEKILAGNIKEANKKLAEYLENYKKDGINSIKKKEEVNLMGRKVY